MDPSLGYMQSPLMINMLQKFSQQPNMTLLNAINSMTHSKSKSSANSSASPTGSMNELDVHPSPAQSPKLVELNAKNAELITNGQATSIKSGLVKPKPHQELATFNSYTNGTDGSASDVGKAASDEAQLNSVSNGGAANRRSTNFSWFKPALDDANRSASSSSSFSSGSSSSVSPPLNTKTNEPILAQQPAQSTQQQASSYNSFNNKMPQSTQPPFGNRNRYNPNYNRQQNWVIFWNLFNFFKFISKKSFG